MFFTQFFRFYCNTTLSRSFVTATLVTMGFFMGSALEFTSSVPTLTFQASASAQEAFSNEEIMNYAQAVLAIEPLRQSTFSEIQKILGTNSVPNIVCNQEQSMSNLPPQVQQVASNYCTSSRQIVESNSLTISRFNQLTTQVKSDPALKARVTDALRQLQ